MLIVGPEDVENVLDLLLERGIRKETVETKHLVYSLFTPTNPTSEIAFIHDDPGVLQEFLQELHRALQGQQAPALLSTQVTTIAPQCRASSWTDFISRTTFTLENNVAEVEAGAMLRVSFAIER